jgi:D-sedoheptulose 7-phosphate isomerase
MIRPIFEEVILQIESSIEVKQAMLQDTNLISSLERLALMGLSCLKSGGKIIFAGNGGSFADAQHLSAEFISRFQFNRAPLASLALATNSSTISAIANDYGFDQIFSRELEAVAQTRDLYIPISTSGNSKNIIESIKVAKKLELSIFCLTGRSGGLTKNYCECIFVPSDVTARIQECHILLGHILCGLIEDMYFKNSQDAPQQKGVI